MESKKNRLDRFIAVKTGINRRDVRLLIAQKRIMIDGQPATQINQVVDQFSHILCDGQLLQNNRPIYLMMNKPVGVVSATKDDQHKTVIDLLDSPQKDLHIAGRLDLNSSGLLLLTNHGAWSRRITAPEHKVNKVYHVTLAKPLTAAYIDAFAEGMFFPYEGITTLPATLKILSEYVAEVTLREGRYHQIKRMFGRFRNPVLKLHRVSIGALTLDNRLNAGESRILTNEELQHLHNTPEPFAFENTD